MTADKTTPCGEQDKLRFVELDDFAEWALEEINLAREKMSDYSERGDPLHACLARIEETLVEYMSDEIIMLGPLKPES